MDPPGGRRSQHREHGRKEKHSSENTTTDRFEDINQPKFGNLIPRASNNTSDELRQFAKNVLGDYDSTMQALHSHQMSRLYGVERTQPITPLTSSSFNIFDTGIKDRMGVTTERRDPVVQAEGRPSHPTFGDHHRSARKANKQPPQSNLKSSERSTVNKSAPQGKFHPYLKPGNHPLTTGASSNEVKTESSDLSPLHNRHSKKHRRNRNEPTRVKVEESSSTQFQTLPDTKAHLRNIGKSTSFQSNPRATSPSNSEKGFSNPNKKTFKRSSSADTPVQSLDINQVFHTGETGHTSFTCSTNVEKKREKKSKRTKRDKDLMVNISPRHSQVDSHVTDGHVTHSSSHMTPVSFPDNKNRSSKPNNLNFSMPTIEESTSDTADLQTMLKEMHNEMQNLPSYLTPIHTPGLKQESPFVFTSSQAMQSTIKEESLIDDNPLLKSTHMATYPAHQLSSEDLIGRISSSSSDDSSSESSSSDSSSEEEEELEEDGEGKHLLGLHPGSVAGDKGAGPLRLNITNEESTSFMLDQISKQSNQLLSTLTPIKSSPIFPTLPFPLTDESANLSPAKPMRLNQQLTNQIPSSHKTETSLGFQTATAPLNTSLLSNRTSSESDSSSSGEESDSESSDSDDDTFPANDSFPGKPPAISYPSTATKYEIPPEISLRQESRPFHFDYEDISQDVVPLEGGVASVTRGSPDPSIGRHRDSVKKDGGRVSNKRKQHTSVPQNVSKSPRLDSESSTGSREEPVAMDTPLLVKIPLWKVPDIQPKTSKPQAKVVPYCVTANRKRTNSSADDLATPRRERMDPHEGRYSRREEADGPYGNDHRHHHGDGGRGHRDRRGWSIEYEGRPPRRGGDSERGGDQGDRRGDRYDRYLRTSSPAGHHPGNRDEYWDYRGSSSGGGGYDRRQYTERSHGNSSEYYFERARSLKREADAINTKGTAKAIKYMQSVAFFMRHGYAQENETKWDGSSSTGGINKAFKIYSDTLNLLKHSMKLGSDCKPLLVNCLRCQSVLLWKMYSLKHKLITQHHKDLSEVFNTSKLSQKSPNPSAASFSPLPSPASVGSTSSSCSGVGVASCNSIEQNVPVTRGVCSKVNEYLTITGYVHQGIELWKQAELMSEQYRDIFSSAERRIGHVTQFSPVAQIADWVDDSLRAISGSKWST